MLIGPGSGCHECGQVYGQHRERCSVPEQEKRERAREVEMSNENLLKRIKRLESRVAALEHGETNN